MILVRNVLLIQYSNTKIVFRKIKLIFGQKKFTLETKDFDKSASNCLIRYQKIGGSLGCKNLSKFTCLTMKFHNCHNATVQDAGIDNYNDDEHGLEVFLCDLIGDPLANSIHQHGHQRSSNSIANNNRVIEKLRSKLTQLPEYVCTILHAFALDCTWWCMRNLWIDIQRPLVAIARNGITYACRHRSRAVCACKHYTLYQNS